MDLIIFTGFHKNGFSSNAENEGDFDCDSDDGEVDHDTETNELVSFENKLLDFIDSKGSRSTILKGVEAGVVVVAQLEEWPLPTSEAHGLNPVIGKL